MRKNELSAIVVRYIYSSCILTKTPDLTILHDPWFTEGIYDGSWYHFPKVEDPINSIGDCDLIYVSHVHPDHYDPVFLKSYFLKWGKKKIIIANHEPNHLANKMRVDNFDVEVLTRPIYIKNTKIEIFTHKTGSISDLDSAIIIKYIDNKASEHCVVNSNDIIFDNESIKKLKDIAGEVDILLCGYTGAGPFPQTYFETSDPELKKQSDQKKMEFFRRYQNLIKFMKAKVNIPFAGKYLLGGKLSHLNEFRGVADPVEVLNFDMNAVILADNGGEIDTLNFLPSMKRTIPYAELNIKNRIEEIKNIEMKYEKLISKEEVYQLPLKRLLFMAARNATSKSECITDYYYCISLQDDEFAIINAKKNSEPVIRFVKNDVTLPEPRSEIYIDPRYLFGLLTHIYHWNNAEVGSQYNTRRYPNLLNRSAQNYLNYFSI
jgi:UDP-MurNAc hydroxylase